MLTPQVRTIIHKQVTNWQSNSERVDTCIRTMVARRRPWMATTIKLSDMATSVMLRLPCSSGLQSVGTTKLLCRRSHDHALHEKTNPNNSKEICFEVVNGSVSVRPPRTRGSCCENVLAHSTTRTTRPRPIAHHTTPPMSGLNTARAGPHAASKAHGSTHGTLKPHCNRKAHAAGLGRTHLRSSGCSPMREHIVGSPQTCVNLHGCVY